MNKERKIIYETDETSLNFYGVRDAITMLEKWLKNHPEAINPTIDIYEYYDNWSTRIKYSRLETDEEYNYRIGKEELDKQNKEKSDRDLYEKLKKQFEGDGK